MLTTHFGGRASHQTFNAVLIDYPASSHVTVTTPIASGCIEMRLLWPLIINEEFLWWQGTNLYRLSTRLAIWMRRAPSNGVVR
jgi:hypothetical protein